MGLIARLREAGSFVREEVAVCREVARHARTPWAAKILISAAVGYAVLPFDVIPDFIPLLGHLDDVIIVPGLIVLGMRMIPREVVDECRATVQVRGTVRTDDEARSDHG